MKPSHVLLGDNGESGCLPNIRPHVYPPISLITTQLTGTKNHITPLKIFETINDDKTPNHKNIKCK